MLLKIAKKNGETEEKKLEKIQAKPFRAPVIIAVAVEPSENPKTIKIEEYGATYACIQNMLLEAHSLGIAGFWRTGKPTYDPLMKEFFGLSENGEVLGFPLLWLSITEFTRRKEKVIRTTYKMDRIDFILKIGYYQSNNMLD